MPKDKKRGLIFLERNSAFDRRDWVGAFNYSNRVDTATKGLVMLYNSTSTSWYCMAWW